MSKEDAGIIGKLQAIALVILSFGLCILSICYGLSFIRQCCKTTSFRAWI